MILDKTGTLTTGEFKVINVDVLSEDHTEEEITALMAGIEAGSSHPIAQSIITHSENEGGRAVEFDSIEVGSGAGVEGQANGEEHELISQKGDEKEIEVEVPKGETRSII